MKAAAGNSCKSSSQLRRLCACRVALWAFELLVVIYAIAPMQYPKTPHSIACRTWAMHDMLHPRQVLPTHTNKHAAPLSKTWHFAKGSSNTYHLTESRQQTAARLAQATKAEYSRRLLLLFDTTSPLRRAAASHSATPRGAAASGALRVRPRRLALARRWDSIAASVAGGHVGRTWRAAKATGIL